MKKKLVSSVLIAAMLLSMTACGSDNQAADSNAQEQPEAQKPVGMAQQQLPIWSL